MKETINVSLREARKRTKTFNQTKGVKLRKHLLLIAITYLCCINIAQGQEIKYPSIKLVAQSEGITDAPFYFYSEYEKKWNKKTGGFYHSIDENFRELTLMKYVANNIVYYCFAYDSSEPHTLNIDTQLLQIRNGTYRGAGIAPDLKRSFYITAKQYEKLKLLLNGNDDGNILLKSKLCDADLGWLLCKKRSRKCKRMKIEKIGDKVRFLLPRQRLVVNFKKCYFEISIEDFKSKLLID